MALFHLTQPAFGGSTAFGGSPASGGLPVIADLPHSGEDIPPDIAWQFKRGLRRKLYGTDWHLDRLYDFLPGLGITTLYATHSRYVVDLNRDWRKSVYGHHTDSVIYRQGFGDEFLYDVEPSSHQVDRRIMRYYLPYHQQLTELLEQTVDKYGRAVLLDLHSFGTDQPDIDVVLGDVNGQSCEETLTGAFEQAFRAQGFSVARNDRWTGGYITQHYGRMENVQALQVELKFRAYLEQKEVRPVYIEEKTEKFRQARKRLKAMFSEALDLANLSGTRP